MASLLAGLGQVESDNPVFRETAWSRALRLESLASDVASPRIDELRAVS